MPVLEFREAIAGDETVLFLMMRALAEQEPGAIPFDESATRLAFRQFLSLPAFGRVWLIYDGAAPIGYIILTMGFSFEFRGHHAFIDELYIVPARRRRGCGREAMAFVEQAARENRCQCHSSRSGERQPSGPRALSPHRLQRSPAFVDDQMVEPCYPRSLGVCL